MLLASRNTDGRLTRIAGDLGGVKQEAKQSSGSVRVEKDFFFKGLLGTAGIGRSR